MVKTEERNAFIEENLRLVHSLCRRFADKGIEYDDLYQAGCVGLIKAADAFDPQLGFQFSTYAVPVILGELRRMFRDGGSVKVSRAVKEMGMKILKKKPLLENQLGREPSLSELSSFMGASVEEITEAVSAAQPVMSLAHENDDGRTEIDLPVAGPEETLFNRLLLDGAFEVLEPQEKILISYRYYRGFTQSKTAKLLNMTQVQVSRQEKRILSKLKNILKE